MAGGVNAVSLFLLEPKDAPAAWLEVLDADERQRHGRFKHEADRACFLAAHGLLRQALSRARPSVAPAAWRFERGAHGKPSLHGGPQFNLSHCRELVAVALGDRPIGVDVEPVDAAHATADVSARVYGPLELDAMRAAGDPVEHFFTRWVLKEAWVKATGLGLDDELPKFQLEIAGPSARVLTTHRPGAWHFAWWNPRPGVKLGLCVEGAPLPTFEPEWWAP